MKRKYCTKISRGRETMDNYTGHREVFSCGFGPRDGVENVSDIVVFWVVFGKEIVQYIVRETKWYAEQYKNAQGNLSSFRSLVRSWTLVTESEIYTVLDLFLLMGIVQKPTARSWGESIWRTSCFTCTWSRGEKITKWYLKLFKRLLNSTVLNSFVVYWQVTGRNIQQLSYRIQQVEGLFMKYARAAETRSVTGW